MTEIHVIQVSPAEVQSQHDRVKWAEGLILQLPADHEGRNSWLLNYGRGPEADALRVKQGFDQFAWDELYECLAPVDSKYPMPHAIKREDLFAEAVKEIIPMFGGMEEKIVKSTQNDFISYCHSQISGGIGMKIRNQYKLWQPDSEMAKYFTSRNIATHPDSMSTELLKAVYNEIKATYKPKT